MALSFMVLGGPRSATTWAANWLTTDTTFCLHDPLLEYTRRQLDVMTIPDKLIGIACTSSILFPEWVLKHPAKKIMLYRPVEEINYSLETLGLPTLDAYAHFKRMKVLMDKGIEPIFWQSLFDREVAAKVWKTLIGTPFDSYRHDLLIQFNVQPQFRNLPVSKEAVTDLVKRTAEVIV